MNDDEPRCAICAYWTPGGPELATALDDQVIGHEIGTCAYMPPVPVVLPRRGYVSTVFPQTHASRVCSVWAARFDDGPDDGERAGPPDGETVVDIAQARRRRGIAA